MMSLSMMRRAAFPLVAMLAACGGAAPRAEETADEATSGSEAGEIGAEDGTIDVVVVEVPLVAFRFRHFCIRRRSAVGDRAVGSQYRRY